MYCFLTSAKRLKRISLLLGLLTGTSAIAQGIPNSVSALLKQFAINPASVSLEVQQVEASKPILSINASAPRNPASVIKVLTTIGALELLGPTYKWTTRYLIDGPINGNTLEGNLVMVGGGDPFLTVDRFWSHILAIRERGIHHIQGNLIIDNTVFNIPPHDRNAFDGQERRLYNVGPDAALTNFSATRFVIEPLNNKINVFADPPLANLQISNLLTAQSGKCVNRNAGWKMRISPEQGKIIARFSGNYRPRCGAHSISRSIMSNPDYTYQLFRYLWESMGGKMSGGFRLGVGSETAKHLVSMPSRSLAENIASINKFSNNVMARQMLLTVGKEWSVDPETDTRVSGKQAINQWLDQVGINANGIILENGSGLSRVSRISAHQINQLLMVGWKSNWRPEFMASFSLTALDGTMRKRLKKSELKGRARIKTGLINGVRSMAGYVNAKSGKHYVVSMMIDSSKVNFWNGNQIQDALLEWIYLQ